MDGRPVEAVIEWRGGWVFGKRGDDARRDWGPQFPGATLLFVRALEILAGLDRGRAFALTEEASRLAGLGCAFHLDDDNGRIALAHIPDGGLIDIIERHNTGCGFAALSWPGETEAVIQETKRRGWRALIVTGGRVEQGAVINYRPGETFDSAAAAQSGEAQFNLDVLPARQVFGVLEARLARPGFAAQAEAWMLDQFRAAVVSLGGVAAPGEILELR